MRNIAGAGGAVFLIVGGLGYFIAASQYPIGKLDDPGPGLMPRLLGIIFICLSVYLMLTNWVGRRSEPLESSTQESQSLELKKPLQVIAVMIFYVAALQPLGFSLSTSLMILFAARFMGLEGWAKPVILSLSTMVLSLLLFGFILDVPLPVGTIWGQ